MTSATSSLSTSRPVPDSDLLSAFVFLDAATLSCMLVCVVLSQQQLLYPHPSPDPSPNPNPYPSPNPNPNA